MKSENDIHAELLNHIIDIELEMFKRVRSAERSVCQERPETFRVMREMTHFVLSIETLQSYLADLQKASAEGRNVLTEKYARMEELIPPLKTNPVIDRIVRIEARWMEELSQTYPRLFETYSVGFEAYLSKELETYSDKTLDLYFKDILLAEKDGRNLAEARYARLAHNIGYDSLGHMEKTLSG